MIQLFNDEDFNIAKSKDLLELECEHCHTVFKKFKHQIKRALSKSQSNRNTYRFCSQECHHKYYTTSVEYTCAQCGKNVTRKPSHMQKIKNTFCCKSCAATYNNTHKKTGTRRSKLEKWLETKFNYTYPELDIKYCDKTKIGSELDIYIPILNTAFELNGIYHYEPIHGTEKLLQIQNNDKRKHHKCIESNIELIIIDVSTLKYTKEQNYEKYFELIRNMIFDKLSNKKCGIN